MDVNFLEVRSMHWYERVHVFRFGLQEMGPLPEEFDAILNRQTLVSLIVPPLSTMHLRAHLRNFLGFEDDEELVPFILNNCLSLPDAGDLWCSASCRESGLLSCATALGVLLLICSIVNVVGSMLRGHCLGGFSGGWAMNGARSYLCGNPWLLQIWLYEHLGLLNLVEDVPIHRYHLEHVEARSLRYQQFSSIWRGKSFLRSMSNRHRCIHWVMKTGGVIAEEFLKEHVKPFCYVRLKSSSSTLTELMP
ncbi:hypothetical protein Ancab_013112 [Ancistrocladus abbreviatus]